MESEGPQSGEGPRREDPADNVVRFPRDWFGPTEDLVPFGPRASEPRADDLDQPAPARADDFWGEDAAAIHDVLEAPEPDAEEPTVIKLVSPPRPGPGHPSARRRAGRAIAIAAAVVACSLLGVARFWPAGGTGSLRASGTNARGLPLLRLPAVVIDPLVWQSARHGTSTKRAGVSVRRRVRAGPAHESPTLTAGHASNGTPVRTQVREPSARSSTGYSEPARATPVSSTGGAASSSGASGGGSGAGGSAAPAGPQGPGAPFGPGQLG